MARDDRSATSAFRSLQPALPWLGRLAAAALIALAAIPTRWVEAGPTFCPIKNIFGRECYGCGMTRALSHLLHGDLASALGYHRASVALLPVLLLLALWSIVVPLWRMASRRTAVPA